MIGYNDGSEAVQNNTSAATKTMTAPTTPK
jgi:hypothetical protein